MRRREKVSVAVGLATLAVCFLAGLLLSPFGKQVGVRTLTGVVLVKNADPAKQVPIKGADIRVTVGQVSIGNRSVHTTSDSSGYFQLTLPRTLPNLEEHLAITHDAYEPLEANRFDPRQLFIARLEALPAAKKIALGTPPLAISNVKIRYTVKAENTFDIGSVVKTFSVPNTGNVRCDEGPTCSPDGQWKGTVTTVVYDAGASNQFIDARGSCVAGPCAFTRVERSNLATPVQKIQFSVLNWSDTATYLIEAEVRRTVMSEMVRESFPSLNGTAMDFTLPAVAEGPSIEAELNGTSIVFPLGPYLLLSWATCTAEAAPERTRLFRCELKPGFAFR